MEDQDKQGEDKRELEIEPLSDKDLETVAGGSSSGCCSCSGCSAPDQA